MLPSMYLQPQQSSVISQAVLAARQKELLLSAVAARRAVAKAALDKEHYGALAEIYAAVVAGAPTTRLYRTLITVTTDERDGYKWILNLKKSTVDYMTREATEHFDTAEHLLNLLYRCEMEQWDKARELVEFVVENAEDSDYVSYESGDEYYQPKVLPEAEAWLDAHSENNETSNNWHSGSIEDGPYDVVHTWRSYVIRS